MRWFAKAGLILGGMAVAAVAVIWLYDNTPLGCYLEEVAPPLKPGTPEYAAMKRAAPYFPKKPFRVDDLKNVRTYVEQPGPGEGPTLAIYPDPNDLTHQEVLNRSDYWFIAFHPIHEKTLFGCDYMHFDGVWTAIVRKRDLMVMNQKDYQ
jgi:hypothetical protein